MIAVRLVVVLVLSVLVIIGASLSAGWAESLLAGSDSIPPGRKSLVLCARIESKDRVLGQLLSRRLTLQEAVASFRQIDAEAPDVPPYRGDLPGGVMCVEGHDVARLLRPPHLS